MKKIFVGLLCGLLMMGCSTEKTVKTTVCSMEQNGLSVESTFEHDGVKITKQTGKNHLVYAEAGVTKEMLEANVAVTSELFQGLKGVTYEYTLGDDEFNETTVIDYTVADLKELQDANIIVLSDAKVDYIGIKETLEMNKEMDCVEK